MASRENTPLLLDRADEEDEDVHRIELSFRTPPKNGTEFIFGWGAGCDVQIAERSNVPKGERNRTRRISQRHFSVGFDAQRRIVIRDTSVNGTVVSYDGQAQKERRMYFQWIILPGWKTIEISIPGAELAFQIQRAVHETWEAAFAANVDALSSTEIGRHDHALAHPMLQLGVGSRGTSVVTSGAVTPRREPIYLLREELGRGTFGRVYTVVDVSTGRQYAGKTFNSGKYEREVAILRSLKHEHIVPFVDFRLEPSPLLVMEYFPLGNVEHLIEQFEVAYGRRILPIEDVIACSSQLLGAVAFAHGRRVVHRDIKPANALVSCMDPLQVKLADFGLAKDNLSSMSMAASFLGTHLYAAPEVYEGHQRPYSYSVDVWSLGVVMLELAYGLPKPKAGLFHPADWHEEVRSQAESVRPDDMAELLSRHMLQVEPEERLPANACLEKVLGLEKALVSRRTASSGGSRSSSLTPTEKASALSTTMWALESGSGCKRQRSPDPNLSAEFERPRTIVRRRNGLRSETSSVQTYAIAKASLFFSGDQSPVYESVLELLNELRLEREFQSHDDPHTVGHVQALCQELQRLQIAEIQKSFCDEAEQTILTATTNEDDFILATLTSSDLENSVAHMAEHLTSILLLRSHEHETRYEGSVNRKLVRDLEDVATPSEVRTSLMKERFAAVDNALGIQVIASSPPQQDRAQYDSKSTFCSATEVDDGSGLFLPHQKGLTYPSSLSDPANVSGCTPPSSSIGVQT